LLFVGNSSASQDFGLDGYQFRGSVQKAARGRTWLRWLAQQMRGEADVPLHLLGQRLRAVDASCVSEPGATGTDWKVHYVVNVADLQCDFFELTPIQQGGETFRRIPIRAGDVMMGDRVYAAPPGVAHVVNAGGDVIVRLNRQALPLYKEVGQRLALLSRMRRLPVSKPQEYVAGVQTREGQWIPGRLIALRQSAEATGLIRRRLKRAGQRSGFRVTPEALEFAEYFMLWTTLPESLSATRILEFYRLRWQIELVFKRMKSLLGLGHLPKKDPLSAQAWLEGKLFVGLLIERMIDSANSFFPWGYPLAASPKSMAGS
jgi:hypothetical protein